MDKQPELSVADFFALGNAAAAHTAALRAAERDDAPLDAEWRELDPDA